MAATQVATFEAISQTNSLNSKAISGLSAQQIEAMTDGELAEVVRIASDRLVHLKRADYLDRQTLKTLAFLARRYCQGQSRTCR